MNENNEESIRCINLAEVAMRNGWSFGGAYIDYNSQRFRATFRRYLKATSGRKRITEEVTGYGDSLSEAITAAAQECFEEAN